MKFLNYNRVLCLSPHTDDVEYCMLGTIMKYKNTKFDIIVLSEGGDFDESTAKSRQEECKKVWEHIDNLNGSFFELDYIKNIPEDELISKINEKYNFDDYQALFVPASTDAHQDHRKISMISSALVRKHSCGIIEYRTPSVLEEWTPNFFVDLNHIGHRNTEDGHSKDTDLVFLAATWYIKLNRLKRFESQQDKLYFDDESLKSFHSTYQCARRGITHVESFRIRRCYS